MRPARRIAVWIQPKVLSAVMAAVTQGAVGFQRSVSVVAGGMTVPRPYVQGLKLSWPLAWSCAVRLSAGLNAHWLKKASRHAASVAATSQPAA